ncbi:TetR/AcrR family transcriptional regulator [Haloactinomyces albus]|uniref:AcrR family transcriptional regulator n=1 Tax=Haloactinomyces albus TaxID=1352928 RepID=A0AAE3ZAV2_9ACTN|nr:TetR/AcrR family transcriptional regulator [Haloactinomyces albus]MDR7299827.1 AcrR family transcriptional regulator [Haloactinomyces albus]
MSDGAHGAERADAKRNRQRIIETALEAFRVSQGTVALEAIARDAGVGIGTLYRHFPSREALIEAVYRNELARLCDGADELVATMPPEQALRAWMGHYADFVATKQGMAETLRAVIASGAITSTDTRQHLSAAVRTMLDAGITAGSLRDDVSAEDVVAGLAGVLLACQQPDQRQQVERLLDLLVDGLRPRTENKPTATCAPN